MATSTRVAVLVCNLGVVVVILVVVIAVLVVHVVMLGTALAVVRVIVIMRATLAVAISAVGGRIISTAAGALHTYGPPTRHANKIVLVVRSPNQAAVTMEAHLIWRHLPRRHRIITVHEHDDFARRPLRSRHFTLDLVADRKAQCLPLQLESFGCGEALIEASCQLVSVQVLADEHQLTLPRLAVSPRLSERAVHRHVHLSK